MHGSPLILSASTVIRSNRVAISDSILPHLWGGMGHVTCMFRALFDAKVNIELITTSEIRITCLIDESQVPKAVRLCTREGQAG